MPTVDPESEIDEVPLDPAPESPPIPLVLGHRGIGWNVTGNPYPENTHLSVQAALAAGADGVEAGPEAAGALRTGDLIRVEFTGLHEGLETVSASSVIGFEVCGTGGACTYATGTVNGEAVMVDVPEGAAADELRYCQGDSPLCNLYDGNGLPAGPFRLAIVSNDQ